MGGAFRGHLPHGAYPFKKGWNAPSSQCLIKCWIVTAITYAMVMLFVFLLVYKKPSIEHSCSRVDPSLFSEESSFIRHIKEDLSIFTGTYSPAHMAAAARSTLHKENVGVGLTVVHLTSDGGELVAGWGWDTGWSVWEHFVERILVNFRFPSIIRYTNKPTIGRPDTTKVLVGYSGWPIKNGRSVFMLMNDRMGDEPVVRRPDKERCEKYLRERSCAMDESTCESPLNWEYPQHSVTSIAYDLPVFSVARLRECSKDILIPWRDLLEAEDHPDSTVSADIKNTSQEAKAASLKPIEEKKGVVWAGAPNGIPMTVDGPMLRSKVIEWARRRNEHTGKDDVKMVMAGVATLTRAQQMQHRVLLDIDGATYSRRLKWYWAEGKSVVMHVGNFEDVALREARDGEEYIAAPLNEVGFNKAVDEILSDDALARHVLEKGRKFGEIIKDPNVWHCYIYHLVRLYAENVDVQGADGAFSPPTARGARPEAVVAILLLPVVTAPAVVLQLYSLLLGMSARVSQAVWLGIPMYFLWLYFFLMQVVAMSEPAPPAPLDLHS